MPLPPGLLDLGSHAGRDGQPNAIVMLYIYRLNGLPILEQVATACLVRRLINGWPETPAKGSLRISSCTSAARGHYISTINYSSNDGRHLVVGAAAAACLLLSLSQMGEICLCQQPSSLGTSRTSGLSPQDLRLASWMKRRVRSKRRSGRGRGLIYGGVASSLWSLRTRADTLWTILH